MNVKLSIIVPVYNGEEYIGECIDSLLNQDLRVEDFEIIIVNDGSTDGTLKIIEEYKGSNSNVRLYSQKNKGLSVTRNMGLEMAKGEYIFFVDADDIVVNGSLKEILDYTVKSNLDFFGFGFRYITTRETGVDFDNNLKIIYEGSGNVLIEQLDYFNACWWYIYKKSKVNNLRFIPDIFSEDVPFTHRLILSMEKCVVIKNDVYLYYRNNPSSITIVKSYSHNKKMFEDRFFVVQNFNKLFSEHPLSNSSLFKLRVRQEAILYYGIIRFLRLHTSFSVVNDALKKLQFEDCKVYPIKTFKGDSKQDKLLLFLINNKLLFRGLNFINSKVKIL